MIRIVWRSLFLQSHLRDGERSPFACRRIAGSLSSRRQDFCSG
ncbi:MAG: hypothetical protein AB4042_18830 [Leptolyngbyaceae cyanobacterium]